MRLHPLGKEKYFSFMNKISTLLSLLSRKELNSEKFRNKFNPNKLLTRRCFTLKNNFEIRINVKNKIETKGLQKFNWPF